MADYIPPKRSKQSPPRGAAAATGYSSWADLNSELLVSIASADGLSLRDYTCLRGVCAGWRCALVPPYPCLLSIHGGGGASVFSLPIRRSFHLHQILYTGIDGRRTSAFSLPMHCPFQEHRDFYKVINGRSHVVGSGNGRLAVAVDVDRRPYGTERIFVVDPRAREEVKILPPPLPFTENKGGNGCVRKVVFAPDPDDGTILAICDGQRVAYIDTRKSGMVWKTVDVITTGDAYWEHYHLADVAFAPGGNGKVYCLDTKGGVRVLRIPRGSQEEPSLTVMSNSGRAAFPRPYNTTFELVATKRLFFCHGSLYQVWQHHSITVRSWFSMAPDEIFVLRYDPDRLYWDAVKHLGGCSVFIGKNSNPVVVGPGVVPGVRGDCVYWIDWKCNSMVCDMATGTSKPCVLPYDRCKVNCWYFGDNNMMSNN